MNDSPARVAAAPSVEAGRDGLSPVALGLLLLAAAGVPASLVWDFAWESTVGLDPVWSPPHTANYLAVALAGLTALSLIIARSVAGPRSEDIRIGKLQAPLAAWVVIWGALVFVGAVLFDRWWQSAYGLAAGIWHPPQIVKAVAFFALLSGVWVGCLSRQNRTANAAGPALFAVGGGLVLVMITVVTLTSIYPNRQHAAWFYKMAAATYPLVLVAVATAGKSRWPATAASLVYTAVLAVLVWLLPLVPATPQVAPIYNPHDHLMPPPFPLLLVVPAIGVDVFLRTGFSPVAAAKPWLRALVTGAVCFVLLLGTQWMFAEFLLSDLADNRFFAGGGRHWPFFLKIDPLARTTFWEVTRDGLNLANTLVAAGLAIAAAFAGSALGAWMKRVRR